jgi:hypothetical protein
MNETGVKMPLPAFISQRSEELRMYVVQNFIMSRQVSKAVSSKTSV